MSELAEVLLRGPGTLTRGERELIAAHVSALNDAGTAPPRIRPPPRPSCPAAWRWSSRSAPTPGRPISAKLKALLAIAAAVQRSGRDVTAELVAQARAAGATAAPSASSTRATCRHPRAPRADLLVPE